MIASRFTENPMQSQEAEMSVLGAMLLSERACEEVQQILRKEDFTGVHGEIYQAFLKVVESKSVLDLVTAKESLGSRLEWCGGIEYLLQIAETVPSASNAIYYAEIVRSKSDLRQLDKRSKEIALACRAGELVKAVAIAESITEGVYTRSNIVNIETVMAEAKKGLRSGIPLFMPELNRFFDANGFGPGLFHGYCAQSGKGKSTWLCQQVIHCLESGYRMGVVSLEMTAADLVIKMIRQMTGLYSEAYAAKLGDDFLAEYQTATAKVRHWLDSGDLAIMDESDDGATENQVIGWMNSQIKAHEMDGFIIDYVQDIQPEPGKKDDYTFHNPLSRRLKEWAKSTQVTLIGLFQIEFDGKEIQFKGGGRYQRDLASIIVKSLGKADEKGHRDEFLVVYKNRYGRLGRVQVFYDDRRQTVSAWGNS